MANEKSSERIIFEANAATIVNALRCTSSTDPVADPKTCTGCPYKITETATYDNKTVTVYTCDCDKVALDAADMIEKMIKVNEDDGR